ncbi:hypothetical protein ACFL10_01145 [Patescibacteria group bacterium]
MLECKQCGNCCPKDCEELIIIDDAPPRTRCNIHTTNKLLCKISPKSQFAKGIACEAGLEALRKLYPNIVIETETDYRGQVYILRSSLREKMQQLMVSLRDERYNTADNRRIFGSAPFP